MAKSNRITNSTVNPGKKRGIMLDHWFGPAQHVGDGISSDPEKAHTKPGTLRTTQHREEPSEIKVKS